MCLLGASLSHRSDNTTRGNKNLKQKFAKLTAWIFVLILVLTMGSTAVYAAGASAGVSGGSAEVGETITVTATFKCDEIIEKSKNGEITDANAISMVLGKVCIMSECGWIPDRIVDKLSDMSRFFCNHMG